MAVDRGCQVVVGFWLEVCAHYLTAEERMTWGKGWVWIVGHSEGGREGGDGGDLIKEKEEWASTKACLSEPVRDTQPGNQDARTD